MCPDMCSLIQMNETTCTTHARCLKVSTVMCCCSKVGILLLNTFVLLTWPLTIAAEKDSLSTTVTQNLTSHEMEYEEIKEGYSQQIVWPTFSLAA